MLTVARAAARLLAALPEAAALPGAVTALTAAQQPRSHAAGVHTSAAASEPQRGGYLGLGHPAHEPDEPRILVTGAGGQVGAELVPYLRERVGLNNVLASDVRGAREQLRNGQGPFIYCDVTDKDSLARIILEYRISTVVHLASLLSAIGERNPQLALRVNTIGIQNVLDLAATNNLQVFAPSTIAVFGSSTPRIMTPDAVVCEPSTMYGITKVHQELLGQYYATKFGVDYRSLRYPGIISSHTMPGGGTTDYAVEMYMAALDKTPYQCFLSEDTPLPMMYMPDCLRATWELMTAPKANLSRTTYNVTAMSFTPRDLEAAIVSSLPDFQVTYSPDFRQDIAKTWPTSIDDSIAQREWNWKPQYDLDGMTRDMLHQLALKAARKAALSGKHGAGVTPDQVSNLLAFKATA